MKISEIGEFGLIDRIASMIKAARDGDTPAERQLVLDIGDDAAAWKTDDSIQLATVDALVENIHFTLETITWGELGWKALAVNLSDIAAMGGTPNYALVSLALPGQTQVDDVTALYRGIIDIAQKFGVAIIGGNMTGAPLVVVNITVLGSSKSENKLLTRSAAKPGDKVVVTGYPGMAAAGLEMLSKHLTFKPADTENLKAAFLTPYPRVNEGQILVDQGVKAAIDISDGLLADLHHICQMSKVGARIDIERLPIHPAVKTNFGDKAIEFALSGGEDYELLFTADAGIIDTLRNEIHCPVTVIGELTAEHAGEIKPVDSTKMGWDRFQGE